MREGYGFQEKMMQKHTETTSIYKPHHHSILHCPNHRMIFRHGPRQRATHRNLLRTISLHHTSQQHHSLPHTSPDATSQQPIKPNHTRDYHRPSPHNRSCASPVSSHAASDHKSRLQYYNSRHHIVSLGSAALLQCFLTSRSLAEGTFCHGFAENYLCSVFLKVAKACKNFQ